MLTFSGTQSWRSSMRMLFVLLVAGSAELSNSEAPGRAHGNATSNHALRGSSKEPPCRIVFVTGFPHTGTTLLQHELLRRSGDNVMSRRDETLPPQFPSCHGHQVYKFPSNNAESAGHHSLTANGDFYNFAKIATRVRQIRDAPNAILTVVFMHRDAQNTLWSRMKRKAHTTSLSYARESNADYCAVQTAWASLRTAEDYDIDLHNYTHSSNEERAALLDRVLGTASLLQLPPSASHGERREAQALMAVYPDDPQAYVKEASAAVSSALRDLSC